ncbi:glycoside hydrolase family 16 protein [Asticcacaulis sp. 201]|uniref:glycoside hydrolase family 16 protein n=1 Tax=Asticcacaulis sp. 201 TaxID=3028787 RepID=UPI00291707CC|nr:glycoside hydrolase family 16 protein [Asticcacaulis sp. 201]MDV6331142.1 glycoside hydrolase family 16 protein [Asticcacaulis sp. 201]
MNFTKTVCGWALAAAPLLLCGGAASAATLQFAGHTWTIRPDGVGGPRDNTWCQANAFVDASGYLHLKLTQTATGWCSAQVSSTDRMGFGTYQWELNTRVDTLDKNVVFGLFHYPTADVGQDGTNEIDIEFTRWGNASANGLNYTAFPTTTSVALTTQNFPISMSGDYSTHRYVWGARSIHFQGTNGHYDTNPLPIADWTYAPSDYTTRISQSPMPVYMNLWITAPPSDGNPVEMIISSFKFTPAP